MPLTQAQGLLLSNDILMRHFIEDLIKVMQLSNFLPFVPVDGDSERWSNPSVALPNATPVGYGGPIPDQTTVPINRAYSFALLGSGRDVFFATQDLQSNVNDQTQAQIEMAIRSLLYEFWNEFITGTGVQPQFQGLDNIISQPAFAGQVIDALNTPVTTTLLDRALRLIGQGEGYADCIYTSGRGYNGIREAFFTRGTIPQQTALRTPDGNGGSKTMVTTHVDGVPVLWSDFVPIHAINQTNIWLLKTGTRHVHAIVPASSGRESMIKVRKTQLPGISIDQYSMTFPVGISVPSVKDIAVIRNVNVSGF